jgi:hypothetical protein
MLKTLGFNRMVNLLHMRKSIQANHPGADENVRAFTTSPAGHRAITTLRSLTARRSFSLARAVAGAGQQAAGKLGACLTHYYYQRG